MFVEAAACGAPVIGGNKDGSWDALREGRLGRRSTTTNRTSLPGPSSPRSIKGEQTTLPRPRYSADRFVAHVGDLVREIAELPKAS